MSELIDTHLQLGIIPFLLFLTVIWIAAWIKDYVDNRIKK